MKRYCLGLRPPVIFVILTLTDMLVSGSAAAQDNPFEAPVLSERPRVFLRNDDFEGLTVAKLREALRRDEFPGARDKLRARPLGRAILWLVDGRQADLEAAIAGLKKMDAQGGTWSDRGLALIELSALFDWLYDQLDDDTRQATIDKIEKAADDAVRHIRGGQAPYYYSRTPGALAGMSVAGLALHGVSDKAEGYLDLFRSWGVNDYFQAYQWVDGAATGATYTFFYTYVDLSQLCAAWWSATGRNPNAWLGENQGDWLDGIVRSYLWYMRPGFAFTDINDQARDLWSTQDQFCQGLDIASYVTRNGYGRTWSQRWLGRFGPALVHPQYGHNLIFRDATLEPRPLTDLPRAALFGRESCGYGFFRSDWPADGQPDSATHVFFRCGDPMNVHGGIAAGEFQVFKHAPLAARGGRYVSYDSPPDQYHRNCISTNVVLFTDPNVPSDRGDQHTRGGLKSDHKTWAQWQAIRERNGLDVASIRDWQVGDGESRCRADLSKTNSATKCKAWVREFVWLADKHLIVMDVVETARPEIRRQWQLHSPTIPQLSDRLITITNRAPRQQWAAASLQPEKPEARLFCQTLAPRAYTLVVHSERAAEAFRADATLQGPVAGNAYHREYGQHVLQIDPGRDGCQTVFLNVLTATDDPGEAPPAASYRMICPGQVEVNVAGSRTILAVPDWFEG